MTSSRILMVIANRLFRDEEYEIPRRAFEASGATVTVASDAAHEAVGKLGLKVQPDMTIAQADPEAFDAVVFVGGPGSKMLWNHPDAHRLAQEIARRECPVAAICSAPIIMANAGLLKGRRATCFPGDKAELERAGATYTARPVERDGRFVTGEGPEAAAEFARTVLNTLRG